MTARLAMYEPDLAPYIAACLVTEDDGRFVVEDRTVFAHDEDDARRRLFQADRHGDIQEIVSVCVEAL